MSGRPVGRSPLDAAMWIVSAQLRRAEYDEEMVNAFAAFVEECEAFKVWLSTQEAEVARAMWSARLADFERAASAYAEGGPREELAAAVSDFRSFMLACRAGACSRGAA